MNPVQFAPGDGDPLYWRLGGGLKNRRDRLTQGSSGVV